MVPGVQNIIKNPKISNLYYIAAVLKLGGRAAAFKVAASSFAQADFNVVIIRWSCHGEV